MLKSRYFCGGSVLAAALAFGMSHVAIAADAAADADARTAEVSEVVVTGSYIAGSSETAAQPVDVIGAKELEQRGSPSMVQFIKTIPSSGAVIGENNRFGAGNGTATVNLRSLNSAVSGARTLVLFNGRRVGASTRALGSVDINSLPTGVMARVEVLKSGAAATYGSDAIGGVVNFLTRKDLNGLEVSGSYQFIDGSDGDYEGNVAWGYVGDRGNLLLNANYRRRSEMPVAERSWALRTGPKGYLENPLGGWAGTGNPGLYNTSATAPVGSPNTGFTAANFAGNLMDIGCGANGGAPYALTTAIVSPTACNFQYTVYDNLVENENHYTLYAETNLSLTDNIEFHGEALFNRNQTPAQSWALTGPNQYPAPILASGASPGGGLSPYPSAGTSEQSRFYIPASNPGLQALIGQIGSANCTGTVLPYGVDAATCAVGLGAAQSQAGFAGLYGVTASQTAWRPVGFAGAAFTADNHGHYSYNTDTWRAVGGFRGKMWHDIGFDVSATYQEVDYRFNLQDTSVNRLQQALRGYGSKASGDQCTAAETANYTTNAGNAALGCFYFNPFTNAMQQSLSNVPANPYYIGTSAIAGLNDAVANRASLIDWMTEEQYSTNRTRLFVADAIFNGKTEIKLWADDTIAWAAGAQFRYDRASRTPDALYDANATPCVDSPPFGDGAPFCPTTQAGPFLFNANITPYDVDRQISSVFGEVRVPVTDKLEFTLAGRYENYKGLGSTSNPKLSVRWQALDWLAFRGSVGTTYRAPPATIVTRGFDRGLTNASGTYRANDLYGNPNLKPETADTTDFGAIVTIGRFSATADYWKFDFKDQLTSEATADLIALALPTAGGCGPAALIARITMTGPCVQTDSAAVNRARILSYRTQYINGGGIKTSGIDFQANLDVGEVMGTRIQTGVDGTWLLTYDEAPYLIEGIPSNAAGVQNRVGTYRASVFTGYNQLRANAYVNLSRGPHNLRWQVRHISSTQQSEALAISLAVNVGSTSKVNEYWQHDLTYTAQLPWESTLTLAVQNLLDTDPPFAIGTQYNYDPGSGTPLGRVFVVGLKKKF